MPRILIVIAGCVAALIVAACVWAYTPDIPRSVLEAKYAPATDAFVDAAGIRVHVRDTGGRSAPAVVLIHGFGSSLQTWEGWATLLSPKYRVVRYDLPGFALTGPDPTGDYSEARGIQILASLMDRLGISRATIIGNSIGGKLAWEFAAEHPARVDKLVLVSPDGFASPGFAYGKPAKVPAWLGLTRYVLPKSFVRMSLVPAYADPSRLNDATVTRYWELMRAPGVRGAMLDRLRQTVLADPEPALRRIEAPTLLLWGEKDQMIPFANTKDYLRLLKAATLAPLPTLGHVPQEEAPTLSLPPVEAFLANSRPQ